MVKLRKAIPTSENNEVDKKSNESYQNNIENKENKSKETPFDFLLKKHPKCRIIDNGDGTYGFIGI